MANNNEAKIKFTAETSAFNDSIKKAESQMKTLKAELSLTETQMKNNGTSVESLEKKHSLLESQLATSGAKVEALNGKLDAAIRNYGEGSTEVDKYRTQLLNAQTAHEKLSAKVDESKTKLDEFKTANTDTRTASEKLSDEINEQQGELDKLKSKYADAVIEYGKNSREAKSLAGEIKTLSGDLSDNKAKLEDASEKADWLDKSLDEAAESATDAATGGFTVLKDALGDLVADGITAVVDGLGQIASSTFTTANDVTSATNTYIAQTGASADAAEEFESVMVDIYNGNYGDSFDDIADSMATVKNNMGDIDTGELQNVTQDALVLRDTFDFDVAESTRAATMLMNQFGMDSETAFNLIATGAQSGLNKNGDLLDVINEYSVHFKQAGYSADDMFTMLASGTDAGAFSVDKLGDAVKEFGIRTKDSSDSSAEAFEMLGLTISDNSEQIKETKDNIASYEEQIAKLEKNLQYAKIQQEGFTDKTSDLTKLKTADNIEAWSTELEELKGKLAVSTESLALMEEQSANGGQTASDLFARFAAGGDTAKEATDEVVTALLAMDDKVKQDQVGVALFGTMWEDLGVQCIDALYSCNSEIDTTKDSLDEINAVKYDDIGSAIEGIKRNLETSVAEPINNEVLPALSDFTEGIDWDAVGTTAGQAVGAIADGFFALVGGVRDAVTWMNEHKGVCIAVAAAVGIIATAITAYNIVQAIKTAMDAAQVTTIWGLVAAHLAQAAAAMAALAPYILIVAAIAAVIAIIVLCIVYWDEIVLAVSNAWEAIKAKLAEWGVWIDANVIQPIVNFFTGLWASVQEIWNNITTAISTAWNNIKTAVATAIETVKTKVTTVWNNIKTSVSNVVNSIKTTVSNVWNNIKTAVSNVVNSIKSTVTNVWNSIKNAISTVVNSVKSTVSNAFTNVKNKISSILTSVKTKISSIWTSIKTNFTTTLTNIVSTVTSKFDSIKTKITDKINSAKDTVKSVIDKIKGFFDFEWSLPKLKMPHLSISGSFSISPPSVPKFSISWWKEGGIMMAPTVFGMNGNNLMAGGEAGPEAILPIDKLEGYISNVIENKMSVVNLQSLADAIENLANRPMEMNIDGKRFAYATAGATDSVGGMRNTFKTRGLALE